MEFQKVKSDTIIGGLAILLLSGLLCYVLMGHKHAPDERPKPAPLDPVPVKKQLIYVRGTNCVFCDKMERQTFTHPKVAERVNNEYTLVKTSGKDAVARYGVQVYPTYLVFDLDGREIRRGTGFRNAEEFLAWLDTDQRRLNGTGEFSPLED